jgi:hypothetical protein
MQQQNHYSVYVIRLRPAIATHRKVRLLNPARDANAPCVYVGMTGLPINQRMANHRNGVKASRWVHRYGEGLMPELYERFNPMTFDEATVKEKQLAAELRADGYTVLGGV